jgi:hypothetical protein
MGNFVLITTIWHAEIVFQQEKLGFASCIFLSNMAKWACQLRSFHE